ncbi:MAG: copper homeostasis membrane protein CopD [Sphingopyxis sp.]|nr:copper homeostasis membrane protein CopD [Sphingopyxis sp.]
MTDLPVIGIRFALYADLMLITGLAAFSFHALAAGERRDPEIAALLARPQRWLCAIGLIVSALGMLVLTANMQGVDMLAVDLPMLLTMIGETDVGTAWTVRMIALLIAAGAAWQARRWSSPVAAIMAIAGAVALASLAWTGHAGATEGLPGTLHRASDALHMIAAAVWLGAILAFLLLLRSLRGAEQVARIARSLDSFAATGTICVLVITATGLVNAELIVGIRNAGASLAAPYGQLLVAKFILFASMLALAAANRWRLVPALGASPVDGDARAAIRAMRRSLVLEAAAGTAILALVAWLGTLAPTS